MQQTRYADASLVARTVDTFGTVLKFAAAGAFSLIFAGGSVGVLLVVSLPGPLNAERFVTAALVGATGTIAATATGLVLFVIATLLCAQAQLLRAGIDTAIHTSALMTEEQRARFTAVVPPEPVARIPIGA